MEQPSQFKPTPQALLLALMAATTALPVTAQDSRQLEEVIVTATKRDESSQNIPVAVSALSGEVLDQMGVAGTRDLVKLSPSLTYTTGNHKQNSGFRLRGIGTNVYSIGVENSVAVIIDDVATIQSGQSIANLQDIERVEILRGPQSTLFGKSASAGVISVTTRNPAAEFEGSVQLSATDDDETRVSASVSGPLGDSAGYRLMTYWSDYDGYVDNLTTGDELNSEEHQGFRGKLRWDVGDATDITFIGYQSESETTCCAFSWADLEDGARVFGIVPGELAAGITPSDENFKVRLDQGIVEPDKVENSGVSIRINSTVGDFGFTSITASDNWEYENAEDVDFSDVNVVAFFTGGALNGGFLSGSETETDFFSQEFRLVSPSYDSFEYLIGFYYADAETDRAFKRNEGLPLFPSDWAGTSTTKSMAVFGQATWKLTDVTHVAVGLRWNDEEIEVNYVDFLDAPDVLLAGQSSDDEVLGNIAFQHFINDEMMLYARYAQGYKGQAYDISSGFTQTKADNPVAPETSDSFSIGIKSTLLENRLQLNATLFSTEYDDFQAQSTRLFPDGSLELTVNNVGKLETQGIEVEGIALIGDSLTMSFSAAYIDAEIKEFLGANCYSGQTAETGCSASASQDIIGGDLPNAPELKYSLAADYQFAVGSMPFNGFVNVSYTWQDDVNFDLLQSPLAKQDSYGVANLSVGIKESENARYEVTAFINNLTDEHYRAGIADLRQLYGGAMSLANIWSRDSKRYYGLRLKFTF